MKVKNLAKHYGGLAKVTDLICYSRTINLAFIEHIFILIYTCNIFHIILRYIYYMLYIYIYILYIYMYIYMYIYICVCVCVYIYITATFYVSLLYYVHLYLENFNLFTLFFHRCFWYYLDNHLFKKTSQLKGVIRSSHQKNRKNFFFVIATCQAYNFTSALPSYEKNE